MVQPHFFCGPEFLLEVPEDYPQPIKSQVLLELQTELYNVLTAAVRRKIHATYGGSSCGSGGDSVVPPPPDRLLFVDMDLRPHLNTGIEEKEDVVQYIILVTDSRAAAELFTIGLKNPFIALPHRIRLRNHYVGSGGRARASPAEILRKGESLRSRMNFDEDLWNTLQEAFTSEWLREFETQYHLQGDGIAPMRETERHEKRVESVLRYCEREVQYVGVMDEEGKASPFLLAMGLFYHLGLTYSDALMHFARHPRRTIRALALFIVRYTAAPEELEPFFAPSLTDEVVIACADDVNVTSSMRQLCEDLLLRDEVCEAWPPTYHVYWIDHKIRPMMEHIETECRRREEMRQSRAQGNKKENNDKYDVGDDVGGGDNMKKRTTQKGGVEVRGSGNGVGVFGFRKLSELQVYVRKRERVLVPQRILFMQARRRGGNGMDLYGGSDDDGDDDDDDDDFLIKVQLEGNSGGQGVGHRGEQRPQQEQQEEERLPPRKQEQRERVTERRKRSRDGTITTDTRSLVVTGAYRTVLRLLGRTEAFDKRGEHYLKF